MLAMRALTGGAAAWLRRARLRAPLMSRSAQIHSQCRVHGAAAGVLSRSRRTMSDSPSAAAKGTVDVIAEEEEDGEGPEDYWDMDLDPKELEKLERTVMEELHKKKLTASKDSLVNHMAPDVRTGWFEHRMYNELNLGRYDMVFHRCNQMMEHQVAPSLVTYNVVFRALNEGNRSDMVPGLFGEMVQKAGLAPDTTSYRLLMHSYLRNNDSDAAMEVLNSCMEQGVAVSRYDFSNILQVCQETGHGENTVRALMAMKQCGLQPSLPMYSKIIRALCSAQDLDAMLSVLYEMEDQGLDVPLDLYSRVFIVSLQFDSLHKAMHCYRRIREAGEILPESSFIALAKMAARHRMGRTVDDLLRSMEADGWTPGVEMYAASAEAHAKSGAVREAIRQISFMLEQDFKIHPSIFYYLTKSIEREDVRLSQALNFCYNLHQKGKPLNTDTLNCLLRAALFMKMYGQVFHLFDELSTLGLEGNVMTYNCLIMAYTETGETVRAIDTFRTMKRLGLSPNKNTYATLIRGLADNDVETGMELFRMALAASINVHVNILEFLCLRLIQANRLDLLEEVKAAHAGSQEKRGVWRLLAQKRDAMRKALDAIGFDATLKGSFRIPNKF